MQQQAGMTLIETLAVVAMISVVAMTAAAYSIPWIAREVVRGAAADVYTMMQLTKVEAITRNRECRLLLDTAEGQLEIWDTNGTADDATDDQLLHERRLPSSVGFTHPDAQPAVTLSEIDGGIFETAFDSSGVVTRGTGDVFLHGGDHFGRVTVYAAGGIEIQY